MAKWTPAQVGAGHAQRPGLARAHAQADGVERVAQVAAAEVLADADVGLELHALGDHLFQPAVEDVFFQLEIGDAVAQAARPAGRPSRTARPRGRRGSTAGRRPGRRGRSRRPPRCLPVFGLGRNGSDPAFCEGPLGDLVLDVLDGDRLVVDGQRAGGLARRGADAAGDLGEVVGRVQVLGRLAPAVAIDQVVELGNAVLHRAADGVAERNAAVHAAGRLLVEHAGDQRPVDLVPVLDPFVRSAGARLRRGRIVETRWDYPSEGDQGLGITAD